MKLIDPMDFSLNEMLAGLQGNIIKGHGRDHTTHIFIRFNQRSAKKAREWLAAFAKDRVTSTKKQLAERERFKRNKVPGGLFANVFLTAEGYRYLGFTDVAIQLNDPAFTDGMKKRTAITNDPDTSKWERGFREEIHAMVLLADEDTHRMALFAKDLLEELDVFSHICAVEYGNAIRNANGDGLEHFGYVDGISQPLFLKDEVEAYMSFHNTTAATAKFDPTADTDLVLIPDPYATDSKAWGSYFVFRKLEQNVKGFKKAEEDLKLGELGGTYLVGRFEDGTPVEMDEDEGMIGSGNFNNFNYDHDPSGGRCPHFAHIRKTNPRNDEEDKTHIMARRGIPFGHREVDTALDPNHAQMPEKGVGLLFMSYQRSITNQFEFIQQNWANNPGFPLAETGFDPIIGQQPDGNEKLSYKFPKAYGQPPSEKKDFKQFVHMKGGEYFFAPSIHFLQSL